ncbi:hypothetical protein [Erythrobacter sp. F6033]|uniref:hypothetical protein n=1 Tax=Erythrobacter sp. F6033 TaxID=2926401 RepID=UPI001FF55DCE|nr:hypothetical protein [Erythrobacter sp. F6033]MCK0127810.1 hypothetical protein [Erythrobacter sp. F6033]
MISFRKAPLLATVLLTSTFALTPTTQAQDNKPAPAKQEVPKPGFKVEMKRGEVLQVIASELRDDGQAAARKYGQTAFPIAQSFGFQRLGQLNVNRKVISDFDPEVFSFFSWPDQASVDAFAKHPDWPAIKATRPDAWSELKVYSVELQDDLKLQFDPSKHYTVLVAWLKTDEAIGDYNKYLEGIESAVERSGGRFIYKMRNPSMEAHASDPAAPHQLTFVEWETTDGFDKVQASQEYLDHRQYFGTSIERVEFYWLKAPS